MATNLPLTKTDPHQQMGTTLAALQRRQKTLQGIKVGVVWVLLIAGLIAGLLLLNIQPSYIFQHFNIILQGAWVTIYVSMLSILIASVLALTHDFGLNQLWQTLFAGSSLHLHDLIFPREIGRAHV